MHEYEYVAPGERKKQPGKAGNRPGVPTPTGVQSPKVVLRQGWQLLWGHLTNYECVKWSSCFWGLQYQSRLLILWRAVKVTNEVGHSHTMFKLCSSPPIGWNWRKLLDERWNIIMKSGRLHVYVSLHLSNCIYVLWFVQHEELFKLPFPNYQ